MRVRLAMRPGKSGGASQEYSAVYGYSAEQYWAMDVYNDG